MNEMTSFKPSYSASIDEARRELHFVSSGFFDEEAMTGLQTEIGKVAAPFLSKGIRFRAFGDLSGYMVQTKEISDKMMIVLERAEQIGIERVAIVIKSAIVRLQYARVSEGRNVKIFDNRDEALEWLRGK